jgi:hypothetical protein
MNFITRFFKKINNKEMEKVKYYLPGIKVKCISAYCRLGETATVVRKINDYDAVYIKYDSDGSEDTARFGTNGKYDLGFVDSQDELLQIAIEKYDGKSFTSLSGTNYQNFKPVKAKWISGHKFDIILDDKDERSAHVYESGQWAKLESPSDDVSDIRVGETIRIKPQKERTLFSYCNVKPTAGYATHNGWAAHDNLEHEVKDVYYAKQFNSWFYKIDCKYGDDDSHWYASDAVELVKAPESKGEWLFEEVFPEEGQCKTITPELEAYLRKTRTPEGDQAQKDKAKAICWNHKGYWYVSRSSQKQEYIITQLSKFFTPKQEQPMEPQDAQQFDYTPQGGFQLTLPPEIVGAALQQATQTHFRESEKKFEKHREDVAALIDKKKQMIETELYQKFEKTIGCDFVEFKTKVVEDYLTSKQVVIELGQDKKYEFSLEDKHAELPKMVTFLQLFKQAMIVGPSGSGKSTMAKQAAEVMGLRYGAFSCNLEASKSELVGFANIDGYVESSFLDFYENGGVFLVDEL